MRAVLLITIDCLRADHLSCYGYHRPTTPTIDEMAGRGVRWQRAYSTSSWTKPSVASMLTGLYPSEHGAFEGIKRSKNRPIVTTDAVRRCRPALAEHFTEAGWRCGAFINNAQLGEFTGLDRGFETYLPQAGKADHLIEAFRAWLSTDARKPAFAYLHLLEAHWPYKPRRRHMTMFGGDRDTNIFRNYSARDFGRLRRSISRGQASIPPYAFEQLIQMYDAAIRRLDGKIKNILTMLRDLHLEDEVAVFVTADHGEEFLEHGGIGHGQSLYDELINVPLVATVPGGPCGLRIDQPVSHVDLAATLLAAARIEHHGTGVNLLDPDAKPRPVVSELRIHQRFVQTLVSGKWKLHLRNRAAAEYAAKKQARQECRPIGSASDNLYELYDLRRDHQERSDLVQTPVGGTVAGNLRSELAEWQHRATAAAAAAQSEQPELELAVVERLRALGYLD